MKNKTTFAIVLFTLFALACVSLSFAIDPPHTPTPEANVSCANCHNPGIGLRFPGIDNSPVNIVCRNCHKAGGSAQAESTHSAHQTGDDVAKRYWSGLWTNECRTCHNPHTQEQSRAHPADYPSGARLYTGTIDSSTENTITVEGSPWAPDEWAGSMLQPKVGLNYFYRITGNTGNTITVDGTMFSFARAAGNTFAISHGKLIRTVMNTGNVNTSEFRTVTFLNSSGAGSFADGDPTREGVCEVCHTLTENPSTNAPRYRRNAHSDSHFEGTDCTGCHTHEEGFEGSFNCVACHSSNMGSRRQVVDSNSDGSGAGGDFIKASHHVNPASGTVGNSDCQMCHDVSAHAGGTVRLVNADTAEVYDYDPADPSTAEAHCLSCHDSDGANGDMGPFSDGKTLGTVPYKMGKDIKTYWGKTYGHRQQGLTCLGDGTPDTGCHANGHGSTYKGILAGQLTLPLTVAGPYVPGHESHYELCFSCHENYPGITKEDILGVKEGGNYDVLHWWWDAKPPYYISAIQTTFRDRWEDTGKSYDHPVAYMYQDPSMPVYSSPIDMNLHFLHLQAGSIWGGVGGWLYRDNTVSNVHCLSCHNVHGSDTQWSWLYDEMQYDHFAGEGTDQYAQI